MVGIPLRREAVRPGVPSPRRASCGRALPKGRFRLALRYISWEARLMFQQQDFVQPEQLHFKDDGIFPNSPLPLLVYRQKLPPNTEDPGLLSNNVLPRMTGVIHGETESMAFPIITALRTRCWVFIRVLQCCASVASTARTSRSTLAT
jgi:hypothetical protein